MAARVGPTCDQVMAVLWEIEPATTAEIRVALNVPWEQRGTVHNRVLELLVEGEIVGDEQHPQRWAVNHL